jgi:adenylosuccinate lyase
MLKRYSRADMAQIWSDKSRFGYWVAVEVAVLRAKVQLGLIQVQVPDDLEDRIVIDVSEIERIEERTSHDVTAFLEHTSAQLPDDLKPHWHDKMTSYDTQDTALGLQLDASLNLILRGLENLMEVIHDLGLKHTDTAMIGRTHGVHAEPITFGVKAANWHAELARHSRRLQAVQNRAAVGKLSGAVGMYTLPPQVEEKVCEMLGLKPTIATQIISRDIHAEYLFVLALIAGTIAKIATNGRLMQQTEIGELQEAFGKNQTGSSAMPHKRNPIGQENETGMARMMRGYALVGLENQDTWHERDLANSGPERIVLPDASILLDYMINRMRRIIQGWVVNPDRMMENLDKIGGLIYSQDVVALLTEKAGLPRQVAYTIVREIAQACITSRGNFCDALLADERVTSIVSVDDIRNCFSLPEKLKYVGYVMERGGID